MNIKFVFKTQFFCASLYNITGRKFYKANTCVSDVRRVEKKETTISVWSNLIRLQWCFQKNLTANVKSKSFESVLLKCNVFTKSHPILPTAPQGVFYIENSRIIHLRCLVNIMINIKDFVERIIPFEGRERLQIQLRQGNIWSDCLFIFVSSTLYSRILLAIVWFFFFLDVLFVSRLSLTCILQAEFFSFLSFRKHRHSARSKITLAVSLFESYRRDGGGKWTHKRKVFLCLNDLCWETCQYYSSVACNFLWKCRQRKWSCYLSHIKFAFECVETW